MLITNKASDPQRQIPMAEYLLSDTISLIRSDGSDVQIVCPMSFGSAIRIAGEKDT